MACRMLPVDEAAVEAGHVFAQRLELRAFAFVPLRLDAIDGLAREKLQRDAMHAAHIGQDVDRSVDGYLPRGLDEPPRSAPAYPHLIDMDLPTPARHDRKRQACGLAGGKHAGDDLGRLDVAALISDELERGGAAPARGGDRRHDRALLADRDVIWPVEPEIKEPRWKRQQGVGERRQQNERAIGERDDPQAWIIDGNDQRQRNPADEGKDGSAGRADHRGAGVWSRISRRIRSVLSPSISAPGDMVRRWRSTGSASAFTSSGITKSRPCSTA